MWKGLLPATRPRSFWAHGQDTAGWLGLCPVMLRPRNLLRLWQQCRHPFPPHCHPVPFVDLCFLGSCLLVLLINMPWGLGLPGSSTGKESTCNAGDIGSIPGKIGKILWRRDRLPTPVFLGFPGGSAGKESALNEGDLGSIPRLGRYPGEPNGYSLQYSGLENSVDCIVHGVAKSQHDWETCIHSLCPGGRGCPGEQKVCPSEPDACSWC